MKKVLILFGGNSYEHEISCKSVNFVLKNIDKNKFKAKVVGIDFDNSWYEIKDIDSIDKNWKNNILKKVKNIISYCKRFDIVFPVIHGNTFEDGKLQALFEMYNIKYVGSNYYSSMISYDKLLTKLFLEKYDIPQVPYTIYNENVSNIQYPIIVKPCKCGSSLGISVVYKKEELSKAIDLAKLYDDKIILEKFIEKNRELECAILETGDKLIVSDVGEIINDTWYDYKSKYEKKVDTTISNIDSEIKKDLQKYTESIFKILGCKGLSRVDFIYDLNDNKLYFNGINTMPGFTEISMYPKLIKECRISFSELISILLNL